MNVTLESIEQAAKQLSVRERGALANSLIKGLDEAEGDEEYIESLWAAEAELRIDAYLNGDLESSDGDRVMARLRENLK